MMQFGIDRSAWSNAAAEVELVVIEGAGHVLSRNPTIAPEEFWALRPRPECSQNSYGPSLKGKCRDNRTSRQLINPATLLTGRFRHGAALIWARV